jgi:hypothetical protein
VDATRSLVVLGVGSTLHLWLLIVPAGSRRTLDVRDGRGALKTERATGCGAQDARVEIKRRSNTGEIFPFETFA